jgi:thioredoxin-dependent peroxiredoxin
VRELREFRAHHDELAATGALVAGVSRETPEANARWVSRLELPYPLLSDREGTAGRALGAVRVLKIAGWSVELVRRATRVRVRGHAQEVLDAVNALDAGRA